MEQKHTEIASIGEFGLIDRINEIATFRVEDSSLQAHLMMGIGDDTAAYRPTPGTIQLFTTDAFIEGVHFDLTFTSLRHLGWKVMAATFSDIAAMGGVPRYATIALSLPKKISVEMVEEFYRGAAFSCQKYSCLIVGGDTVTSLTNMAVSVTVVGEALEHHVVYRKGAQPGEYLCVTGHLGASVAGLKILQREKQQFLAAAERAQFQPRLESYTAAIEKHLMPKPRFDISRMLTHDVKIGAMIDVSDGLSSEVHHLCKNSAVGAAIFEHNLPIDHLTQEIAAEFSNSPIDYALYGGEEYELLFTISDEEFEKLTKLTNDVTIIGRITEPQKGIMLVRENGEQEALRFGGWDHFK